MDTTNLPETSAPAGEGAMMTGSSGMGGQLDPLAAPMMTSTPAVATSSQEIAGSDMATIPTVLETMGGLEPTGLILTNYAANVVALCNKDIYVKRYNITSNTAAETIIDEIDFNPWDQNLVSAPIAIYGGAHTMFNGSIDITINSYSAATIVGSVILAYVPPLLQKNFKPTLTNLTTVPHTILNLKVGGSSKITITGGNLKDCAVSKEEIDSGNSVYGKLYLAAFTDIVNAYGVAVSIPVVRFASLGKDSYFSHPAYLVGSGGGGVINPGPTPPSIENIILDSAVLYTAQRVDNSINFYYPTNNNGKIKLIPWYDSKLNQINPSVPNIPGSSKGVNPSFYWGSNTIGSTFDGIGNSVKQNGDDSTSAVIETAGPPYEEYEIGYVVNAPDNTFPFGDVAFTYNGLTLNVTGGLYFQFLKNFLTFDKQGCDVGLPATNAISVDFNIYNIKDDAGAIDGAGNTVAVYVLTTNLPNSTDFIYNKEIEYFNGASGAIHLYDEAATSTLEILGAPVLGNTPPSEPAPNGFVAVYFDDDAPFIPAVLPTANTTRSMPWPRAHNRYMAQVELWFAQNPLIRSFSYTGTLSSGEVLGDFLVNRKGVFMYDTITSAVNYAVFGNASTVVYQNYQSYQTDFPSIAEYNSDQFTSRVVSPQQTYSYATPFKPLRNQLVFANMNQRHIEKALQDLYKRMDKWVKDEPQMFAAQLVTAGAGGMAGVFGAKAQREHETEMQKREMRYWAAGQKLDYNKAIRLGTMRSDTEMQKARIQKDVAMAQYGYNANAVMRGSGNSFNTGSNTSNKSTQTSPPRSNNAGTQAGRVNHGARSLSQPKTQLSGTSSVTVEAASGEATSQMDPAPTPPGPSGPSPSGSSYMYRSTG